MNELARLNIPIPQILRNGQNGDVYYTLITYINGKDIGDIYHTLNDFQKRDIAKELVAIQKKVSALPPNLIDGFENYSPVGSLAYIENHNDIQRKALTFYTLLYCIDFMGERGEKFNNDVVVPVNFFYIFRVWQTCRFGT